MELINKFMWKNELPQILETKESCQCADTNQGFYRCIACVQWEQTEKWIETEIIEKLISEIPDGTYNGIDLGFLKNQLKATWLERN